MGQTQTLSTGDAADGRSHLRTFLTLGVAGGRAVGPWWRRPLDDVAVVVIGRGDRSAALREVVDGVSTLRIRLPDPFLSGFHARMLRRGSDWVVEDAGSKNGTFVGGARLAQAVLLDGDVIAAGRSAMVFRQLESGGATDGDLDLPGEAAPEGTATLSPVLARALEPLARAAERGLAVRISGETGTGKELVARAAHELARDRCGRRGPFVAVNCGAIPRDLVEAELFGHRRGAFSGAAHDSEGLVRSADGGTLFLDEIGDLPLAAQAALLRVLQEREVTSIGSARRVKVDFQLVCASHRDLEARVAEGLFRDDLLARLAGLRIHLPPLRQRREDLGLLAGTLLRRSLPDAAADLEITREAIQALWAHDWPQNIRELKAALDHALVLRGAGPIQLAHLPEPVQRSAAEEAGPEDRTPPPAGTAELRAELEVLLREHHGNLAAVARAMGKARMQVHRWMRRLGLSAERYRR